MYLKIKWDNKQSHILVLLMIVFLCLISENKTEFNRFRKHRFVNDEASKKLSCC